MTESVRIDRLGHRGDGIADTSTGAVYVPFTLPGELVSIERHGERGRLLEIIEPAAERVAPICRHFHRCGGCSLQMTDLADSRRFKRRLVVDALREKGVEAEVGDTIGVDPASRRRAVFTALRNGNSIRLGFNERHSNTLIDLEHCPVLLPALADKLPALRRLLALLVSGRKPARLTVLATRTGLDLDLRDVAAAPRRVLPDVVARAQAGGVARLTVAGETLLTFADPVIHVAGVALVPPPGAFAQASAEAETAMTALVVEHLAGARRVADLFSGFGTFALALARTARVKAVESHQPALDALLRAAHGGKGLRPIQTERRDLFAFPLGPAELRPFDGVVFDPPRAGAEQQARLLAGSAVPRIAAVSCNPASFARDARLLIDGGYRLQKVIPVDQFVYSAETEVVGLFARA